MTTSCSTVGTAFDSIRSLTAYLDQQFVLRRFLPLLWKHHQSAQQLSERLFGPRDRSYTFVGFLASRDIGNRATIYVYELSDGAKTVSIDIPMWCLDHPELTALAIAHETVHCLCPVSGEATNFLEEGAAEFCAVAYVRHCGWDYDPLKNDPLYAEAYTMVRDLLTAYPDSIVNLRRSTPSFLEITADILKRHCPTLSSDIVNKLTQLLIT